MKMRLLLTGSTGFLGRKLLHHFSVNNFYTIATTRNITDNQLIDNAEYFKVEGVDEKTYWSPALKNIDVVIHCAARVHVMQDSVADPLSEYRKVNTLGTLNLAKQAAQAGVKRFIFISTIKVNGEETSPDIPFTAFDSPAPIDAYGMSKYEAEKGLLQLAQESAMEVVIIRPPLIYGPGVKANFLSILNLVRKPVPLPFASIRENKRSMISTYNLIDFIMQCLQHPHAANKVFLVSDDEDISTQELLSVLRDEQQGKSLLFPMPIYVLNILATITGKRNVIDRLTGSLRVDIEYAKKELNWKPLFTFRESIEKTLREME